VREQAGGTGVARGGGYRDTWLEEGVASAVV